MKIQVIALAIASLVQSSVCFTRSGLASAPVVKSNSVLFDVPDGMFFADDNAPEETSEEEKPAAEFVPGAERPTMQQAPRRLDPLVASVTRVDSNMATKNGKTTNVPFIGEIPADGSLLLLAPAAIMAILGFVFSIYIGYNARDTFVDQLYQLSDDINAAALSKTNQAPADGGCRGLCSSQDAQLESMRSFMKGLAKDE